MWIRLLLLFLPALGLILVSCSVGFFSTSVVLRLSKKGRATSLRPTNASTDALKRRTNGSMESYFEEAPDRRQHPRAIPE